MDRIVDCQAADAPFRVGRVVAAAQEHRVHRRWYAELRGDRPRQPRSRIAAT